MMRLVSSLTQSITKNFLFSFFKVNIEDMLETQILLEQQLFNSGKSLEIPNKIDIVNTSHARAAARRALLMHFGEICFMFQL